MTCASTSSKLFSQIVPKIPLCRISTVPSIGPSISLISLGFTVVEDCVSVLVEDFALISIIINKKLTTSDLKCFTVFTSTIQHDLSPLTPFPRELCILNICLHTYRCFSPLVKVYAQLCTDTTQIMLRVCLSITVTVIHKLW